MKPPASPDVAARARGSALLLSLWALFLLSAAILAWAEWINHDLQLSGEANRSFEARAMARSGITMALHIAVSKYSPQLERDFGSELGYRVRMIGEAGKLNVNQLLQSEDPQKLLIFKRWLEYKGLDFQERETFLDCLLDYVDGDNVKRLNGVEDFGDYHPANRPLQSIEEIAEVANSEFLTSKPGWKDDLTLFGSGRIDISAASPEILRLLDLGDARIRNFLIMRAGRDGIDGTQDDPEVNEKFAQQAFGFDTNQIKRLSGLIVYKDQITRIIAIGHSGKVVRQLEIVAQKGSPNPPIYYWKE
jgi:hypothetical protein